MIKRILLGLALLAWHFSLAQEPNELILKKSVWNEASQTLDLIIQTPESVYSQWVAFQDHLGLQTDADSIQSWSLHSLYRGDELQSLSPSRPESLLVLVDRSIAMQPHLSQVYALIEQILNQYHPTYKVELAFFNHFVSQTFPLTTENILLTYEELEEAFPLTRNSHFLNVFTQLRTELKKYERVLLLSQGATSVQFENHPDHWQLDETFTFGNTKIIPVAVGPEYNTAYFDYLESYNVFDLQRDEKNVIPLHLESTSGLTNSSHCVLRFQLDPSLKWTKQVKSFSLIMPDLHPDSVFISGKVILPYFDSIWNHGRPNRQVPFVTLICGIALCLILFYLIPIFNRYYFKKHHVGPFEKWIALGSRQDPLKQSPILSDDQVVCFNDQVMLLDSWKFVSKSKETIPSMAGYDHFFQPRIPGTLFTQDQGLWKWLLPCWMATTLALVLTSLDFFAGLPLWTADLQAPYVLAIYPFRGVDFWLLCLFNVSLLVGLQCIAISLRVGFHTWWPKEGILLGKTTLVGCLLTLLQVIALQHVPDVLREISTHLLLSLCISYFILTWSKYEKTQLAIQISMLTILSMIAFWGIPTLLNTGGVGIFPTYLGCLLFSLGIAFELGKMRSSFQPLVMTIFPPFKNPEVRKDLPCPWSDQRSIQIGTSSEEDIQLQDTSKISFSIHCDSQQTKLIPKEDGLSLNENPIPQAAHLKVGDILTDSKGRTIAQFKIPNA